MVFISLYSKFHAEEASLLSRANANANLMDQASLAGRVNKMTSVHAALDYVSSDLAFSLSYQIASELFQAAKESDLSNNSLIFYIITIACVVAIVPKSIKHIYSLLKNKQKNDEALEYFLKLHKIAVRILLAIVVQLITTTAVSVQNFERAHRILALASTVVFFIFLEQASSATD